jgi:hypothetical protein
MRFRGDGVQWSVNLVVCALACSAFWGVARWAWPMELRETVRPEV